MSLDSTRLFLGQRPNNMLCDGLFIRAEAGTITAIMGPAGAGKSVLLEILGAYLRPTRGTVYFDGVDLHANYKTIRRQIGFVPQADVMIPELTVADSLDYRLRLHERLPREQRQQEIERVCASLGFGEKLQKILHQRIGSPEWRGDYPSGGERRRINIAHELIGKPSVLFLDEPTSGLSTVDAEKVMTTLRSLADDCELMILMTIHQPSRELFQQMNDLLLIYRGKPAYYGDAAFAVEYFQQNSNIRLTADQNPAEFVLDFVRDEELGEAAVKEFEGNLARSDVRLKLPLPGSANATGGP